jgi:hypothetical protein
MPAMQCLQKPSGRAIVAAKSYYFGVGGGVAAFKAVVEAEALFSISHLKTIRDDSSNIREIIELTWR